MERPTSDEASAVGQRIMKLRQDLNLSKSALARDCDLSPSSISLIESGHRKPGPEALARLADRLDVEAAYLRDGISEAERTKARLSLKKAQIEVEQSSADKAHQQFTNLISKQSVLTDDELWQARLGLARANERLGNYADACALLTDMANEARAAPEQRPWLDVAIAASRCYRAAGELDTALKVGEEAMRGAKELGLSNTHEYVLLGLTVGGVYEQRGDVTTSTEMHDDLLKRADEIGTPHTRGTAYWNAARIAEDRGEIAQAVRLIDLAQAMFDDSNDRRNLSRLRFRYAHLLASEGSAQSAENAIELVESTIDKLDDGTPKTDIALASEIKARALLGLSRLDEARAAAEDAIEEMPDTAHIPSVTAHITLARVLWARDDREGAVQACKAAMTVLAEIEPSAKTATVYELLADIYADLGQIEDAKAAYKEALRAAQWRTKISARVGHTKTMTSASYVPWPVA